MIRTREDYHEALFSMRGNVYIGGEKVGRDDPRLRPGINVIDVSYELARKPLWRDLSTQRSPFDGKEISRWSYLPRNPYDLMQKQKLIRLAARRVGGCIQRCMGLDALIALAICTKEMDLTMGSRYHERFLRYLSYYQSRDIDGCCAQTDSKGDRMKRPSEQPNPDSYVHLVEQTKEGIVVSGMKMSITQAAYADELIVLPTRALREDDRDFAVAFAVPTDTEGIRLITRPFAFGGGDCRNTDSLSRFGVADSVVIFDNVLVPWDRVFMCGEWEFGRRLALLFAASHRHSYCGCKPAVSDILCGAAGLAAEANNIEGEEHVRHRLSEFAGIAELAYSAGIASALFGEATSAGVFFPSMKYVNVGRRLAGSIIYQEFNMLTEIAGGIAATLPFSEDFTAEDTRADLEKFIVRNGELTADTSLKIWRLIEYIGASPMTAWHEIAGVHGGGSPIMETITLSREYDYDSRKRLARYLAGIDEEYDDSDDLWSEPTFGHSLIEDTRCGSVNGSRTRVAARS
ncbi:MAG TPA: aromatic ring hydroxylase [Deltaproteobacteria bacterium]|nr:aromatic ring hydroxylase [Deltaproteobacteria bacterium]